MHHRIKYLDPDISRFTPNLMYWFFIPCDILSLALQASGGAMSSISIGNNKIGVNVSLAGLALQVFTLILFILVSADYSNRYRVSRRRCTLSMKFKIFAFSLLTAILLILIRCSYRIGELSEGYSGPLFVNEGLFLALESM